MVSCYSMHQINICFETWFSHFFNRFKQKQLLKMLKSAVPEVILYNLELLEYISQLYVIRDT